MADDVLIGMDVCVRKLNDIAGNDGKFMKVTLVKALRKGSDFLLRLMQAAWGKESGATVRSMKMKLRSKNGPAMLVGAVKNTSFTFYAGFANFGHAWGGAGRRVDRKKRAKFGHEGFVEGKQWTELVKADFPMVIKIITDTLTKDISDLANGK